MPTFATVCVVLPLVMTALDGADAPALAKHVYPLAKRRASPEVVADASQVPAAAAWLEVARGLVLDWYPEVCALLATDELDAPRNVRLVVRKSMDVPAATSGDEIAVNGAWIAAHPDDFGMVIHELVHVVQRYPDAGKQGWLVEGIADFVRWWRYEPEMPRTPIDAKASWTDGYRTTAAFLAWCVRTYDRRVVVTLDRALRKREDAAPAFERITGKTYEAAW